MPVSSLSVAPEIHRRPSYRCYGYQLGHVIVSAAFAERGDPAGMAVVGNERSVKLTLRVTAKKTENEFSEVQIVYPLPVIGKKIMHQRREIYCGVEDLPRFGKVRHI